MTLRLLAASLALSLTLPAAAAVAQDPPAEAPAPRQAFTIDNGRLTLPAPVTFETGRDVLTADAAQVVDFIAAFLADKTYITTLRLEGHVARDTPDGQRLSERRALALARALVARGADCKRLLPVGFGDTKPVADSRTAEGRAANTRVEVAPAALRGHAIGGMPVDGGGLVAGDPCAP